MFWCYDSLFIPCFSYPVRLLDKEIYSIILISIILIVLRLAFVLLSIVCRIHFRSNLLSSGETPLFQVGGYTIKFWFETYVFYLSFRMMHKISCFIVFSIFLSFCA